MCHGCQKRHSKVTESDFRFLGYRVTEFNLKIGDKFGEKPEQIRNNIEIQQRFSTENKRLLEIVLNIRTESDSKELSLFFSIRGGFKASDDMSDKTFNKLAMQNAPAILFPFARSIIASCTAQANIAPIFLPIVNLTAGSNKLDSAQQKA